MIIYLYFECLEGLNIVNVFYTHTEIYIYVLYVHIQIIIIIIIVQTWI